MGSCMRVAPRNLAKISAIKGKICLKGIEKRRGYKVQDAETPYVRSREINWITNQKTRNAPKLDIKKSLLFARRTAQVLIVSQ